jgi:flagellar P-ring protein FlgI
MFDHHHSGIKVLKALLLAISIASSSFISPAMASVVRIKDVVDFQGVRGNDLVGYGLVVGLNGTGDSVKNSPYTEEALQNMLERLGVNVSGENFRPKNVAAVLVTASLPPFSRAGSKVDVNVSAIGDSKSLLGGTLVMTPLNAADGQIYAVAQGQVLAGGVSAEGQAASITKGVPTAGVVPAGARVERETGFDLNQLDTLNLAVRDADFTTANRITKAINDKYKKQIATLMDSGTVQVKVPATSGGGRVAQFIANIENLPVSPDQSAKVVVDQRSGTIVMGADVRISTVAVSQGNLTVKVLETPLVSQPNALSNGETVVTPRTQVDIDQQKDKKMIVLREGPTLSDLVSGMNALGVGPRDMIDILSAIKAAGALHADFIVR